MHDRATRGFEGRHLSIYACCAAFFSLLGLTGCSTAPSQNILGSYFPSWMLCAFAGIAAAVVVRQILGAVGLDKSLPAPLVVYLALTVAFAFGSWLLWLD
ncbi:hypothetical protein GCM10011611_00180 [Aliidongia dinghuensis]|uniref:Uncharacterized protein YtcA n=1 Tax=Aliidongia dinghuensis TaxID=1867774 RepID=A0A8J2YP94_9PROT|nr:YtcA family lipoprotein [Aliidongia dinghuensis]GGE98636.1 hypothetical protein GCM10011611_00180 [Aliidongia dinghuensis]